jgi:hypothetical protein
MKNNLFKSAFFAITFFSLVIFADTSVRSQTTQPELCVAGFCLGDKEETVKAKLQGFSPRFDNERQQPKYFFYNEYGTQTQRAESVLVCHYHQFIIGFTSDLSQIGNDKRQKFELLKAINLKISCRLGN